MAESRNSFAWSTQVGAGMGWECKTSRSMALRESSCVLPVVLTNICSSIPNLESPLQSTDTCSCPCRESLRQVEQDGTILETRRGSFRRNQTGSPISTLRSRSCHPVLRPGLAWRQRRAAPISRGFREVTLVSGPLYTGQCEYEVLVCQISPRWQELVYSSSTDTIGLADLWFPYERS